MPFASMLDLGIRFPHIRELHLGSIVVRPNTAQRAPLQLQHPRFAWLKSLVIANWSSNLPVEDVFSSSMLHLLQHMPRLRSLTIYAPTTRPFVEPAGITEQYPAGNPLQYPELPCSLTQFICVAAIPVTVCAHIISSSRGKLEEIKVNLFDDDDAPLIPALARAAPRLRELDLGLRLRTDNAVWPQVKSVFAALARLEILSLETPLGLQPTLELLTGLVSLRALTLWCTLNAPEVREASVADSQLTAHVLRLTCLRSVTVCGFNVGDEERGGLLALCRSRRIDCYIAN